MVKQAWVVVKIAEWWLVPITSDQCGENPGHVDLLMLEDTTHTYMYMHTRTYTMYMYMHMCMQIIMYGVEVCACTCTCYDVHALVRLLLLSDNGKHSYVHSIIGWSLGYVGHPVLGNRSNIQQGGCSLANKHYIHTQAWHNGCLTVHLTLNYQQTKGEPSPMSVTYIVHVDLVRSITSTWTHLELKN